MDHTVFDTADAGAFALTTSWCDAELDYKPPPARDSRRRFTTRRGFKQTSATLPRAYRIVEIRRLA
jgi:hypothetical protein